MWDKGGGNTNEAEEGTGCLRGFALVLFRAERFGPPDVCDVRGESEDEKTLHG